MGKHFILSVVLGLLSAIILFLMFNSELAVVNFIEWGVLTVMFYAMFGFLYGLAAVTNTKPKEQDEPKGKKLSKVGLSFVWMFPILIVGSFFLILSLGA